MIMRYFLYAILSLIFATKVNAQRLSVTGEWHDIKTKAYCGEAKIDLLVQEQTSKGRALFLWIRPYPGSTGLGYFFNKTSSLSSTFQSIVPQNGGLAIVISTKNADEDEEESRQYIGLYPETSGYYIYFYTKPYEDSDPNHKSYYLKLNKDDFYSLFVEICNQDTFFRVLPPFTN